MKITCAREKLLSAFQTVSPVVPTRPTPKVILKNLKLETGDNRATLLATDDQIAVRCEIDGLLVEQAGTTVLPTNRFGAILRELADEEIKLETYDRGTLIKGSRSEFRLPSEDPQEFPTVAPFAESKYHTLPARALREMIRRTIFATDDESSRYALGGLLVELAPDKLTLVGTDGRRMAVMEGKAEAVEGHAAPKGTQTIIPSRAMNIIERALGDEEGDCDLAVRGNDALVRAGRATIYSRLLEGRFPRWQAVFPKKSDVKKIDMVVGPFYAAVRQAAIVTGEESRGVDFRFADGQLSLAAEVSQLGESHVDLPISYDGPALSIKLDPRFLTDFFRVLEPDASIEAELRDEESAAVFSLADYRYVIMPLSPRTRSRVTNA